MRLQYLLSLSWVVKSQYTWATCLTVVTFSTESACLYRLEGCSSIFSMRLFCLKTGLACSHSSLVLVFKSFFLVFNFGDLYYVGYK